MWGYHCNNAWLWCNHYIILHFRDFVSLHIKNISVSTNTRNIKWCGYFKLKLGRWNKTSATSSSIFISIQHNQWIYFIYEELFLYLWFETFISNKLNWLNSTSCYLWAKLTKIIITQQCKHYRLRTLRFTLQFFNECDFWIYTPIFLSKHLQLLANTCYSLIFTFIGRMCMWFIDIHFYFSVQ